MQLWEEWRSEGAVGPEEATKAGRLLNERCFLLFFLLLTFTHKCGRVSCWKETRVL